MISKVSKKLKRKLNRVSRVEKTFHFPVPKYHKLVFAPLPVIPIIKDRNNLRRRKYFLEYFRQKPVYRFLTKMPNCLHAIYSIDTAVSIDLILNYVNQYELLVATKGEVYAIDLLKKIHGACLRFSCNSKFEKIDYIKSDELGLPLMVSSFKPHLMSSVPDQRRGALAVLSLFKLVIVRGETPSLESIVQPFPISLPSTGSYRGEFFDLVSSSLDQDKRLYPKLSVKYREVLEEMFPKRFWKSRLKSISRSSKVHVSSRNGPNSQAVGGALIDLLALHQDPDLLGSIRQLATLTGHVDLLDLLQSDPILKAEIEKADSAKPPLHSRLSIKFEPGAKTRFFAICDYFTQSVLKGFHNWIFKYLSTLPEDGTLSQDRVCSIVRSWTLDTFPKSAEVYSTDLSKATDRLPAFLQREIVRQIAGREFSELWFNIVTKRHFTVPNSSLKVRFEVGQPLGAYSSWAMLAVVHHVICRLAMKLENITRDKLTPSYVVVGDDNALFGTEFEKAYRYIMVDLCKVSVSPLKGFSRETLSGDNPLAFVSHTVAEFCKRVFYNGIEMSTVSPVSLKEATEYAVNFPMLISDINKRELTLKLDDVALLAWLNYNPDQAMTIISFPLSNALQGNILEGLKERAEDLGIRWFEDEVYPLLEPLYYDSLLGEVMKSIEEYSRKVPLFKGSFGESLSLKGYFIKAASWYRRLLGLVSDQISYSLTQLVDRIKPGEIDRSLLRRVVDGLFDLEDFQKIMFSTKTLPPDDRPRRISSRLSKLIWKCSKSSRDVSSLVSLYEIYKSPSSVAKDDIDVVFIEAEDDWEFVVPIHPYEINEDGRSPPETEFDFG